MKTELAEGKDFLAYDPEHGAQACFSSEEMRELLQSYDCPPSIIHLVLAGAVLATAEGVFGKAGKVLRWVELKSKQGPQKHVDVLNEALAIAADLTNTDASRRASAVLRMETKHLITLAHEVRRLQEEMEDVRLEDKAARTYREYKQCSE